MALEGTRYRALTFDCYGTLIDWDAGIRAALRVIPALKGLDLERLLAEREAAEIRYQATTYRSYSGILGDSLKDAAAAQGVKLRYGDILGFIRSMPTWPAFKDVAKPLLRLAMNYPLVILSNVENETLEKSVKKLGAPFVARITAEDVKSYKPAPGHWEKALKRLSHPKERILHVAGSLFHDIRPASALGFDTVWINRKKAPVPEDIGTTQVFTDLTGLADALLGPGTAG
ncbi:MAG: haloacid dehalogenase type II [Planctomycetota bacterium]